MPGPVNAAAAEAGAAAPKPQGPPTNKSTGLTQSRPRFARQSVAAPQARPPGQCAARASSDTLEMRVAAPAA
jgi:hypothetical protein